MDARAAGDAMAIAFQEEGTDGHFAHLVNHFKDRVYRVIYRMLRDTEESLDLTQEVFLKVYTGAGKWDRRSAFYSWLYRMSVNLAIDHLRRRTRMRPMAPDTIARVTVDPGQTEVIDEADEARVLLARAERVIAALPDGQRAVLVLRHHEGLTLKEIAEVRGIAVGTVKSTLFQAFQNVRRALEVSRAGQDVGGDDGQRM